MKRGRKLKRTVSHRRALLMNLAMGLIAHKRIKTTLAKAKELRGYVERMISFAKRGDISSRRHVARYIRDRKTVQELFGEIAPKYTERNGGYTRVLKLGQRSSDAAEMAFVELVGFEGFVRKKEEQKAKQKEEKAKKKEKEAAESEKQQPPPASS